MQTEFSCCGGTETPELIREQRRRTGLDINLCQSLGQYCLWSAPSDVTVKDWYGNNLFTRVAQSAAGVCNTEEQQNFTASWTHTHTGGLTGEVWTHGEVRSLFSALLQLQSSQRSCYSHLNCFKKQVQFLTKTPDSGFSLTSVSEDLKTTTAKNGKSWF